ncbi:MAG: hypothetical protein JO000_13595 [Alphaproteobacteria bacterium]|nr:hypothetical protein [Alphaproteobacteria bacterium]
MDRDIKEVLGVLMRVAGGGETTREEVESLAFDADGALGVAVNGGFLKLMEFTFDRDKRLQDPGLDKAMRAELERALHEIARIAAR